MDAYEPGPSRPRRPSSPTHPRPSLDLDNDTENYLDVPYPLGPSDVHPTNSHTSLPSASEPPPPLYEDDDPSLGLLPQEDSRARLSREEQQGGGGGRGDGGIVDGGGGGGGGGEAHKGVHMATLEQKKALWWRNVLITGIFICFWYAFATVLSIYNKWMFSPEYYDFGFPLFVTFCHMVVQFTIALIIRRTWPAKFRPEERPTRQGYITKIFPTAISTGGDIGLSNVSLKTITLSLYTMCKSSSLIFVLLFAFLFRLESYSLRLISVISLISLGVFMMVFDTTSVSIPGIVMVFSASALGGLRWALTELLMNKKSMGLSNPFATIFWLAPVMAFTLAVVSMGVEGWGNVFASEHWKGGMALWTAGVLLFPGVVAFAMVASEFFIIQRAGVVPMSIAGIFKEVSTISISAWVFGDQLTPLNIVGVAVTVSGITLYTWHKYQKSLHEEVVLDDAGRPVHDGEGQADRGEYQVLGQPVGHRGEREPLRGSSSGVDGVPMESLSVRSLPDGVGKPLESPEERADRMRDEFEGWNERDDWDGRDDGEEGEDGISEVGEDEVARRMGEREQHDTEGALKAKWGEWWGKSM